MISFELAKKLKDAGFPSPEQTGKYSRWTLAETYGAAYSLDGKSLLRLFPGWCFDPNYSIYIPTLSELIEACNPHDFFRLQFRKKSVNEIRMSSTGELLETETYEGGWSCRDIRIEGKEIKPSHTPEEAVANFFLTLHPISPASN